MAVIDLLLGLPQFKTTIGVLRLDAATSITHEAGVQITKNPIEDGSDVTDNARIENRTLQIEGVISDEPLNPTQAGLNLFTGAVAGAIGELAGGFAARAAVTELGSLAGIIASRNDEDVLYPQKAYNYLQELRRNRIPFTIVTSLEAYDNMMLTRLTVPRTADEGRSLRFQATFEQIQVVATEVVTLPETQTTTSAVPKQDTGKQTGVEDPGSTVLFDITNSMVDLRSGIGAN